MLKFKRLKLIPNVINPYLKHFVVLVLSLTKNNNYKRNLCIPISLQQDVEDYQTI